MSSNNYSHKSSYSYDNQYAQQRSNYSSGQKWSSRKSQPSSSRKKYDDYQYQSKGSASTSPNSSFTSLSPGTSEVRSSNSHYYDRVYKYNQARHSTGNSSTYETNSSYANNVYSATPNPFSTPPPTHYINPASYTTYPPPTALSSVPYTGSYASSASSMYGNMSNYHRKRHMPTEVDLTQKKKRKKPLSQNVPTRKDWSVHEAQKALEVEKEFTKRHRSQSLIIKFPDLELNRDIVLKFHSGIDSVHFQQPSTPRFCFVTLAAGMNPQEVIDDLSKVKFGDGYLMAEYKKDREDEINIGPEDIDPLTLYVGNLAQEVTKEDIVKAYPKHRRIDIGFAKKMKYTRYAFVCFRTVEDSIEAFQNTHATEMYSKSLIVRFRRLHGTVGMPGEPKPQNTVKKNSNQLAEDANTNPIDMDLDTTEDIFDPNQVKQEPQWDIESNYSKPKSFPQSSESLDELLKRHKPKLKTEIKQESRDEFDPDMPQSSDDDSLNEDEPLPPMFYQDFPSENERIHQPTGENIKVNGPDTHPPSKQLRIDEQTHTNSEKLLCDVPKVKIPKPDTNNDDKKQKIAEGDKQRMNLPEIPQERQQNVDFVGDGLVRVKEEMEFDNIFQPIQATTHHPLVEPKQEMPTLEDTQTRINDEVIVKQEVEDIEEENDSSDEDNAFNFDSMLSQMNSKKRTANSQP